MNSKYQKLNEKILQVSKIIERNKIEEENNEQNYKKFENNSISLDKNILLKGKIGSLEDDFNSKISKLKKKYDELSSDLTNISNYLNSSFESENSYTIDLFNDINNIKNNLYNIYDEENNKLEQEINYYSQNLSNHIQSLENYDINENLKNKEAISNLEKFSENIIKEIYDKIKMYNLNSDDEKKEKVQEICRGLISEEEIINDIKNNNEMLLLELKDKFNKSLNDMMNNFVNMEENKREKFKNNILNILAETLNKIIVNQTKKENI